MRIHRRSRSPACPCGPGCFHTQKAQSQTRKAESQKQNDKDWKECGTEIVAYHTLVCDASSAIVFCGVVPNLDHTGVKLIRTILFPLQLCCKPPSCSSWLLRGFLRKRSLSSNGACVATPILPLSSWLVKVCAD